MGQFPDTIDLYSTEILSSQKGKGSFNIELQVVGSWAVSLTKARPGPGCYGFLGLCCTC